MKDEIYYSFDCVKHIRTTFPDAMITNITEPFDFLKFSVEIPDYLSNRYYKFMIKNKHTKKSANLIKKSQTEEGRRYIQGLEEEINKEQLVV